MGIGTVPNSGVVVAGSWRNDRSHDGGDVECGPFWHDQLQEWILSESLPLFFDSVLGWDSSGIVDRVGLVPVVVGLHQEPGRVGEFIEGMNCLSFSFNNSSLISLNSGDDVVDWSSNFLSFESFDSISVCFLIFECPSQQTDNRVGIVLQDTDEIIICVISFSCVDIDSKCPMADASQSENTANDSIDTEDSFPIFVVLYIGDQIWNKVPHLEVKISAMHDLSIWISHYHPSAGLEGWKLIEEVEEKETVKGMSTDLS